MNRWSTPELNYSLRGIHASKLQLQRVYLVHGAESTVRVRGYQPSLSSRWVCSVTPAERTTLGYQRCSMGPCQIGLAQHRNVSDLQVLPSLSNASLAGKIRQMLLPEKWQSPSVIGVRSQLHELSGVAPPPRPFLPPLKCWPPPKRTEPLQRHLSSQVCQHCRALPGDSEFQPNTWYNVAKPIAHGGRRKGCGSYP